MVVNNMKDGSTYNTYGNYLLLPYMEIYILTYHEGTDYLYINKPVKNLNTVDYGHLIFNIASINTSVDFCPVLI